MPRRTVALWTRTSPGSRQGDGARGAEEALRRDPVCARCWRREQPGCVGEFGRDYFLQLERWGRSQIVVLLGRSFQLSFTGSAAAQYVKAITESSKSSDVPPAQIRACFPFPANLESSFCVWEVTPISFICIKANFWSRSLLDGSAFPSPYKKPDLHGCSKLL